MGRLFQLFGSSNPQIDISLTRKSTDLFPSRFPPYKSRKLRENNLVSGQSLEIDPGLIRSLVIFWSVLGSQLSNQ